MFVRCDICSHEYPLVFSEELYSHVDKTQGCGCASFKWDETHIRCFYGSKYDDMKFMWVNEVRPQEYNTCDNICDLCIDNLLSQNIIVDVTVYGTLVPNP
jgi:hypothetical protein